jgi:hypothetical protein
MMTSGEPGAGDTIDEETLARAVILESKSRIPMRWLLLNEDGVGRYLYVGDRFLHVYLGRVGDDWPRTVCVFDTGEVFSVARNGELGEDRPISILAVLQTLSNRLNFRFMDFLEGVKKRLPQEQAEELDTELLISMMKKE